MKMYNYALAIALLAVCGVAFADNSGTLHRKGKTIAVTAVYVQPKESKQGSDFIVFSDNAKAASDVEKKANTQYSSVDGIFSADHIFHDLADDGAHPIQLSIGPTDYDGTQNLDLEMIKSKGQPSVHLDASRIQLHIDSQDDRRIEGTLKYVDKDLALDLVFALDKGKFGTQAAAPPEPLRPPEPTNSVGALMAATGLLQLRESQYYKDHKTWPTSINQPELADALDYQPKMIHAVTLGSGGVII